MIPAAPDARGWLIAGLAALAPVAGAGQSSRPSPNDVVWHWYGPCAGKDSLVLDVTLDGQPVYRSTFPICKQRRGDIKPEPQQRMLEFHLNAAPKRFRAGSEKGVQSIRTNVWEATQETYGIRFGFSFSTEERVLLNTIHVARPGASARSEQVRGLVITTRPVPKQAP
jgi:hypothetical protein